MDRQVDIQADLFRVLSNDTEIKKLVNDRVYDNVPQPTRYPYIVIGECTFVDWDSDTFTGSESTATIHVWSRPGKQGGPSGRLETKIIQSAIYTALHRKPIGNYVIDNFIEFAETFMEPEGETRRGVQRLRIITIN